MKLFSLLLIGIYADEPEPNYSDDLRYTRCQAVHLQAISNFTVPESHITEDPPGYICPDPLDTGNGVDAWQQGVKKWDKNKNSQTGMYDVGYFYLSESDSAKVNTIDNKFKEWGQKTCVNFVKVSKNDSKYEKKLKIEFTGGCASYVGSHYAEQTMWLGPRCENSYIPLHEAMHAIGFWHEHQRGDRDDHVQINANACSMSGQSFDVNFGKTHYTWGNTGHAYDFGSIMHYDPFACARSRSNPVITYPGTNTAVVLTKGDTFSDIDVAQINAMYPCDKTQTTQPPTTTKPGPTTTTKPKPTTTIAPGVKEWHGDTSIATWEFIGGLRSWHGDNNCLFDDQYTDRNMYHSNECDGERGIKIKFLKPVKWYDVKFYVRQRCCRERYADVCLFADGKKIACTPDNFAESDVTPFLNMAAFALTGDDIVGREFELMWPPNVVSCAQVEELFFYYDNDVTSTTKKPTTTEPPTTEVPTTTTTEGRQRNCKQKRVEPTISKDFCSDLNAVSNLNMKVEKDGYSDGQNPGSFASVRCKKGYKWNIGTWQAEKIKTKATCACVGNKCNWKFSKGNVLCVECAPNVLQGKTGRSIQVVNRWDTGVTIQWRIKGYATSSAGWSVGLALPQALESDKHWIESYALEVVGKSNDWQFFTFSTKESSNLWDINQFSGRTAPLMVTFHFDGDEQAVQNDIEAVIQAGNYYYKALAEDQSCFVDRFDCYPLDV